MNQNPIAKTDAQMCREYRERRKAKGLPLTRGEPRTPEAERVYQKAYRTRAHVKEEERLRSNERRRDPLQTSKITARMILNNEIISGRVVRQKCRQCGALKAEAHHEDYSKPMEVVWLCRPCHVALHIRKPLVCDGAGPHSRLKESRLLPTGGDSNAILCFSCFRHEIRFRMERNRELGEGCRFDLPAWHTLQIV